MESNAIYDQIVELAEAFKADGANFKDKKNKTAGGRARKATQAIEKLGKAYRKATVTEEKSF